MEGRRADWVTGVVLLVLSAGVLLAQPPDGRLIGGKHLVGAEVILRGGIPYRDFWTMYAPGHYYILAGLLALFGRHWEVSRLAAIACFAVAVPLFHGLLRQLGASRGGAVVGAAILLAVLIATPFWKQFGTYPPTLVLLLLAWRSYLLRLGGEAAPSRLFLVGLWLGAAALCKHDVAAYAAIAMTGGLVLDGVLRGRPARSAAEVGWLGLGALLIFAPPMLALAARSGPDMFRDLFVFPATKFRFARPEGYPGLIPLELQGQTGSWRGWFFAVCYWASLTMPLAVALGGAVAAFARRPDPLPRRDLRPAYFALGVVFALHFAVAHVQINTHVVSMTLYAVALAVALDAAWARGLLRRGLLLAVGLGWVAALTAEPVLDPLLRRGHDDLVALGLPTASRVRVFRADAENLRQLRVLVNSRVPPGDPILVAEHRNDIVISNAVELYFLMDRPPATRYDEMHPAVADTVAVQREIVRRLSAAPPRLVVLREGFDDAVLDDFEARLRKHVPGVGSKLLDAFVHAHYREIAVLGRDHVLVRRDDVASPPNALPDAGTLR